MGRRIWTEKGLALLAELYPTETTRHTARMTGMSERAVKDMAGKLGISKSVKKKHKEWMGHIRLHFHEHTIREMARDLNVSRSTVSRIVTQLGLKRTKEQRSGIQSRVRSGIISRERRRAIFGLDPITRVKVFTNRAKIQLRCKLKSLGYIVGEEHNVMYYPDSLARRDVLEANGMKLGLHFLPYPDDGDALLVTAI